MHKLHSLLMLDPYTEKWCHRFAYSDDPHLYQAQSAEVIEVQVGAWFRRQLSLKGRVEVCAVYIFPLILYRLPVLPLPRDHRVALEQSLSKLLWKGRSPLVSRQVCCQRPWEGGLGMPDLESHRLAERLAHLGRSLTKKTVWGHSFLPFSPPLKTFQALCPLFYKKCVNIFSQKEIKSFESQWGTTRDELEWRTAGEDFWGREKGIFTKRFVLQLKHIDKHDCIWKIISSLDICKTIRRNWFHVFFFCFFFFVFFCYRGGIPSPHFFQLFNAKSILYK